MGNGYRVPPVDGLDEISSEMSKSRARDSEVEAPTGSQVFAALAKVKQLILDLPGQVAAATVAFLTGGFTTGGMHSTGAVTVGSNVSATGVGTFDAGVTSVGAYNTSVSGSGSFRQAYVNLLGVFGHVPSSARFKQDIVTAMLDRATIRALRMVMYRYIDAVGFLGDDAPVELGVIAEEVHELGLTFLVDYDEDGLPFGVNDRAMTFVAMWLAQDAHDRIDEIERRLG